MSESQEPYHKTYERHMKAAPSKEMLWLLIGMRSHKEGYCYTSNASFAEFFNVPERYIYRWKAALQAVKETKFKGKVFVAMDNDGAGARAQQELSDGLTRMNVECEAVNIAGEHKDANEALEADREAFTETVRTLIADDDPQAYAMESTSSKVAAFYAMDKPRQRFKTGFPQLDDLLGGGGDGK